MNPATMARHIDRKCPKCRDYFGVTISQPSPRRSEFLIYGFCAMCGYRLSGWRLIVGQMGKPDIRYLRTRKVFR
jgi:hypothetical protein